MLNREERNSAELNFCEFIEKTIELSHLVAEKSKFQFMKDGLEEVRSHLFSLKRFYLDEFKSTIQREQKERTLNHFKVPGSLYHSIVVARQELKEQQRSLKSVQDEFESKKESLKNKKWLISENAAASYREQTLKIAHSIEERGKQYEERSLEYAKLKQKRDAKQIEIDSHCCSFFRACVKKESDELVKLESDLDAVGDDLKKISESAAVSVQSNTRLMTELKQIDDELEQKNHEYMIKLNDGEKKVEEAKKTLYKFKFAEENAEAEFNNKISYDTLVSYIKFYDSFVIYQETIDKKLEAFSKLVKIKDSLLQVESKITNLMVILKCPEFSNKNIIEIYNCYIRLNKIEKKSFLEKNASPDVLEKIKQTVPSSTVKPLPLPIIFSSEYKLSHGLSESKRAAAPSIIFNV